MSKRIPYIDFAAGIMILWMIIYHALCCSWGFSVRSDDFTNPCVFFPYLSFFMPWFFYKSGQLFEKRSWKEHMTKDARKLLLTFAIWSAIGYIMYLIFGVFQHYLTLRGATYSIARGLFLTGKIPINEPLWFLLTLFGVRIIANWLLPDRGEKNGWIKIVAIVLAGYALAYCCYLWNHPLLPYWIANGASGIAFFTIGYAFRDYECKWWVIIPCAIVYIVCCIFGSPLVDMMYNKWLGGCYMLWLPTAFCGIVTFNALCTWITTHVRLRSIELAGQNAMTIYVTHILIVTTCIFLVDHNEWSRCYPYILWIILGAYVILLPLFCYFIPKISILVGKTKSITK